MKIRSLGEIYKECMRAVPSPVIVVSTALENVKRGMTCSSFTSISLEPPIVSFALRYPSKMAELLEKREKFAVHLLSTDQVAQSKAFSAPASQSNFDSFPHYHQENIPILQGCLNVLICKTFHKILVGDHLVWFGVVEKILPDGIQKIDGKYLPLKPLLYYEKGYRSIGDDDAFLRAFESTSLPFAAWTHRNHLRMAYLYSKEENSYEIIKQGIINFNIANRNVVQHEFNETITSFFYKIVQLAIKEDCHCGNFLSFLQNYPELDRFELIFKYYSKERLYTKEAIESFVDPDLRPVPITIAELRAE